MSSAKGFNVKRLRGGALVLYQKGQKKVTATVIAVENFLTV